MPVKPVKPVKAGKPSKKPVKSPPPSLRRIVAGFRALAGRAREHRRWVIAAVAVAGAVVVAAVAVEVWPQDGPKLPPTRARAYKDFDACLLTGADGIKAGSAAVPVWKGLQDASQKTGIRVTYLEVTGEQSEGNALPFLNSLVQQQCDVVLAVGAPQVAAVEGVAKKYPKVRFVVVDGKAVAGNVTDAASGDGLAEAVAGAAEGAFEAAGK
jgi:basic membrane lipoprotein Med (substrate-binding protein (PBP1-ABC) superfamily)